VSEGADGAGVLLFMCVANSSRSQMAEAIARELAPRGLEVWSAGSEPTAVNPFAVRALAELGIDASTARAKSVDDLDAGRVTKVITLCAEEVCPAFPRPVAREHWPLEDPAAADGSDADKLAAFRRVRDQIRERLARYFAG
jgi:arsenate reductase